LTERIAPTHTLADLVTELSGRAEVLERHGLDYCCGGARTLADACTAAHLDLDRVVADLEEADATHAPAPTDVGALVDHLLEHHRFLHEELPRLCELAGKVLRTHGERHRDLVGLHARVMELHAELEPHLLKEEMVLFPACRAFAAETGPLTFPFGSIVNPIRNMMHEHDGTGALLDRLGRHLDDHPLADDACASYASLYDGIRAVIADTHEHVFEENHLLFPAVLELERQRLAGKDR
jgi:regulator of cell morphogenesis and NO signaling